MKSGFHRGWLSYKGGWIAVLSGLAGLAVYFGVYNFLDPRGTVNCYQRVIESLDDIGIVIGVFVTLFGAGFAFQNRNKLLSIIVSSHKFPNSGRKFNQSKEKVKVLILPISNNFKNLVSEWLIYYLEPNEVHFLLSKDEDTLDKARKIVRTFENLPKNKGTKRKPTVFKFNIDFYPKNILSEGFVFGRNNCNFSDLNAVRKRVMEVYKTCTGKIDKGDFELKNIFFDTTNGRVITSLGGFIVAEETGISSIYVNPSGVENLITKDKDGKEKKTPIIKHYTNEKEAKIIFVSDHS